MIGTIILPIAIGYFTSIIMTKTYDDIEMDIKKLEKIKIY